MRRATIGRTALAAATAAIALGDPATAGDTFEISRHTVDCGGETSFAGDLELAGTIGQPDAGVVMTGGDFAFTGGFWAQSGGAACVGDFSGNGVVDVADIIALLSVWGCTTCPREDLSGNGVVDVADIIALLGAWGACP